jgi:hypothetical protein
MRTEISTILDPKPASTCLFQHFSSALTVFDGLSARSSLLLMVLTAELPKMLGVDRMRRWNFQYVSATSST